MSMARFLPTTALRCIWCIDQLQERCSVSIRRILTIMACSGLYSCNLWALCLCSSQCCFRTIFHHLIDQLRLFFGSFAHYKLWISLLDALFCSLFVSEVFPMKVKYDENGYQVYDQIWDNVNAIDRKVWFTNSLRNIDRHYDKYGDRCRANHDDPIAYSKGN